MVDEAAAIPVLVLTGPVGVGKTAVAAELSDLLQQQGTAHAVIDMDWLRWCHPCPTEDPFHTALGLRNLAAVWANYRAVGVACLVLVDIVETRAMLAAYQEAMPFAKIDVVRLNATLPAIRRRLEGRETGASLAWHQARAAELLGLMEVQGVEDLLVETDGKTVAEVAQEVLAATGWGGKQTFVVP
jgi:adenylylsulfate kinase